jgi:hypothetical protein
MVKVPKAVHDSVWKKYMGNKTEGRCYCCKLETITVFNFEVGHNKARIKGGSDDIENLRPICKTCNTSMATQSIESFRAKHFSFTTSGLTKSSRNILKSKTTKKKPLSKEDLNKLTPTQLKLLANKHNIKVKGTTYTEYIFGTKVASHTNPPTKLKYIKELFGKVFEGDKFQ